jgi:hypothetical protein
MFILLISINFSDRVASAYQIDQFNDIEGGLSLMQMMDGIGVRFENDKLMRVPGF